ncbi:MAG: T9SS type A sorting domain-containing protein [Bacteroidales bacterium]|jgi:photosystem II stability/assembly factor-like uncharacterized protein|nr:T9SS type A sorting domain-containing protein [Bacteroidales bacterium]
MRTHFFTIAIAQLLIFISIKAFPQWIPSDTGLPDAISVKYFLKVNSRVLAATSKGIYVSDDDGHSWIQKNNGLHKLNVANIQYEGPDLYLIGGDSLYKSTDNGDNWIYINAMPSTYCYELLVFSDIIFTSVGSSVRASYDHGLTWIPKNNGLLETGHLVAITALDSMLFVGFSDGGIWYSVDTANTWQQIDTGFIPNDSYVFNFATQNHNLLCAIWSTSGSLLQSNNYGQSWNNISYFTSMEVEQVYWFGNDIFVVTDNGSPDSTTTIYRSNDNGSNWYPYNQGVKIQSWTRTFIVVNNDVLCGTQPIEPHYNQPQYDSVGIWRRSLTQSGIEKEISDENSILVYPNPATNHLYIENKSNDKLFSIYNIQGQLILKGLLQHDINNINITDLSEGVYIIHMFDNYSILTKRILKK